MATERARSRGQIGPGYRILGVDPGTRILGYAVLELDRELRPQALRHGVCRLSSKETLPERLRKIFVALTGFVEQLDPDVVVVEDVFYGKNIQSAFRIGESRAVVLLVAALAEREIIEYSPATVKRAICGNGRAPKTQVQKTVERLLPLQESPATGSGRSSMCARCEKSPSLDGGITDIHPFIPLSKSVVSTIAPESEMLSKTEWPQLVRICPSSSLNDPSDRTSKNRTMSPGLVRRVVPGSKSKLSMPERFPVRL